MLMTSGYNFEGYSIIEYLGVYSGECALGTGFLSTLGASFADFFGSKSAMYSDKLKKAKEYAIEQLVNEANRVGGNTIIGLDIDYTTFSADIMGVIASGTVVKIQKDKIVISEEKKKIRIRSANKGMPFRPSALEFGSGKENQFAVLEIYCQSVGNISGILTDIVFTTIFDETYTIKGKEFIEFSEEKDKWVVSSPTSLTIPENIVRGMKYVDIVVKKYIENNTLLTVPDDGFEITPENSAGNLEGENESVVDDFRVDEFIKDVEGMGRASHILDHIRNYSGGGIVFDQTIMSKLESTVNMERIYGNMKNHMINQIKEYLGIEQS